MNNSLGDLRKVTLERRREMDLAVTRTMPRLPTAAAPPSPVSLPVVPAEVSSVPLEQMTEEQLKTELKAVDGCLQRYKKKRKMIVLMLEEFEVVESEWH